MLKKKKMLAQMAAFLMAFTAIVPLGGACWIFFVGEPRLPRRVMKDNS